MEHHSVLESSSTKEAKDLKSNLGHKLLPDLKNAPLPCPASEKN